MDIRGFVNDSIRKKVGQKANGINDDSNLQDIGLDSLHITQLIVEIEEELSIELEDEDVLEILTSATFGEFITSLSKLSRKRSGEKMEAIL